MTAEYEINQYTISFDSNAGSAVADVQVDYGTKIAAPTAPTRVGYTFDGWYKEAGFTNVWNFNMDTVPAAASTLYAKWSIQTHTVTFKDWNGDTLKTDIVDYGSGAAAPVDPTRTGYTFTGWDIAFTNVTASTVVTAEYAINQYTISFDSNDGSAVAEVQADYGTKIAAPTAPTRVGHTFDDWYKEAGLTNVWNFSVDTVPVDGITLHAKWTINTNMVVFEDWNGDLLKQQTVDYGSDAVAPTNPTRNGYTFTGWDTVFTNVTGNVTVTAEYEVNKYEVSFISNGGSTVSAVQVDFGTQVSEPATPTRLGYTFDDWYKESGLTNVWNFHVDTVPVDGITLHAKWVINTNAVVFKDWNGDVLNSQTVDYGSDAVAPTNPTRNGYTFTGWDTAFTNVTGNVTLTAEYEVNKYEVSFISNGGSSVSTVQADFGTKITETAAPMRAGYAFKGWYTEAELTNAWNFAVNTVPVDGITLHAKWAATYTITYNGNGNAEGSVPNDNIAYEQGQTAVVLGNSGSLTRAGYTFAGWNTEEDGKGTAYAAGAALAINKTNVTLYTQWTLTPTSTPTRPASTGFEVYVNGKAESAGTVTTATTNGQKVTTVVLDEVQLTQRLNSEGDRPIITIKLGAGSDVVVSELNGRMVKNMESKQAMIEVQTDKAIYTLLMKEINIDAISAELGTSVNLADIKLRIEIGSPLGETIRVVDNSASNGGFTLVVAPLNFTIHAVFGDKKVAIAKFNTYVERAFAIPTGVDPNKITTGLVVEPNGSVRHVPTKVVKNENNYFAKVNSLTNSTYAIVWHPLEFTDMMNHWARNAVNNMGSRMVIDGTGNGAFSPDRDITRAEFAAILVRGLGLKPEEGAAPFSDVKAAAWYNSAIQTAYAYNLINGFEDGTFHPNDKITREQAMVIISKAMTITGLKETISNQSIEVTLRPYLDAVQASTWAQAGIADSVLSGVVSGRTSSELAPKKFITRAEVAVIVERLLQKSDLI